MLISRRDIEQIIQRYKNEEKNKLIYQLALNSDLRQLNAVLENEYRYDDQEKYLPHLAFRAQRHEYVWYSSHYLGVSLLFPCVLKLIRNHKINEASRLFQYAKRQYLFPTSLSGNDMHNKIAYYAAVNGYRFFAEEVLAETKNVICYIVAGAAEYQDYIFLENLFEQEPRTIHIATDYVARTGDFEKTAELVSRGALMQSALFGAAFGGWRDYVNDIVNKENFSQETLYCAAHIAMGGGFCHLGEILLLKSGVQLRDISDHFISKAMHRGDVDPQYLKNLQLSILLDPVLRLNNRQEMLTHIQRYRNIAGNACLPFEDVLNTATKALDLKRRYVGLNNTEVVSLLNKDNRSAVIYFLSMFVFYHPKILKIGLLPEMLMEIFSFIFGFNDNPCINRKNGIGLFFSTLALEYKPEFSQKNKKVNNKCCCAVM